MCITPNTLYRDYMTIDGRRTDIVPCGKCHECLMSRTKQWAFRLKKEKEVSTSSAMITFTYAEEPSSFNGYATLKKSDLQKFWKRLRKKYPNRKIKYYAAGEYGTVTLRPHYHAIVFNLPDHALAQSERMAEKIWQHGHIDIVECNMATITYTAKYIMKGLWKPVQHDDDRQPEFSSMSKNLGRSYLSPQMVKYHLDGMINHVTLSGGVLQQLPRYYKDKIFSKLEKIQLAKDAKEYRELNIQEWLDFDHDMDIQEKCDGIRRHRKQQILNRQKL